MRSILSGGVVCLAVDPKIEAFVRAQSENPFPGPTRGTAVLNEEGQLYRTILSDGPIEASELADLLLSLGLIDRVGFDQGTLQVVDSLTGQPLSTRWSGVFQSGDFPHPIPDVPRLT
ncbi:hypothetical protein LJR290_007538 [Variovorax sp. LjRoot290]|uniref:hypothetical protein n=1 Tax=Variovorax sp. LjRoot290 TaxID=3342316 RepID=UPI003ECEFD81